jgi:thiamine transport system permease protein
VTALVAGTLVAAAIFATIGGSLVALLLQGGTSSDLLSITPYLARVVGFSLAQATASTVLSLGLGVALSLALARRRFPGWHIALASLGAAAVMPAIVVVFAVVDVYGRSGWLAQGLALVGIDPGWRIYGWPGILVAHLFLNVPLVARACLHALATIPAEHWRLAQVLGFSPGQIARHLDWPALKGELPGLAGLVFLLCFTSFAIVLTLGGGRATLEVAIFEALRGDLDFARAAWIAVLQMVLCAAIVLLLRRTIKSSPVPNTLRLAGRRPDSADPTLRLLDAVVLLVCTLLILPPLLSVAVGIKHLRTILDADVASALLTSLLIGFWSAVLALAMSLALAAAARAADLRQRPSRVAVILELVPTALLAVPPFALTAGLYLIIHNDVAPTLAGYILLPLMNALSALPFTYRFVAGPMLIAGKRYSRLADMLGLQGYTRIMIVDWPLLRRPLMAALALAAALSLGDFGIVALFGGGELRTLPYLLYERLGSYRFDEAGALSLLLLSLALALAFMASRGADAPR